jgi:prolyl oligopeptidase
MSLPRICLVALAASMLSAQTPLTYPSTRKLDVVDHYFGTNIPDPYRWLEDDQSLDTKAWVKAQNEVTEGYLSTIPERGRIQARLTRLWDYEKYGAPSKHGEHYVYSHNSGLQSQAVLFVTENLADRGRVLLDPNALSSAGTVALNGVSFSEDGRHMAYGLSDSGSDWVTWKVKDVATGKDLADEVRWTKFGRAAWNRSGSGFFYNRYEPPAKADQLTAANRAQKIFFHRMGTPQTSDVLVHHRPDRPNLMFGTMVTDDGHWLVISESEGSQNRNDLKLVDLTSEPGAPAVAFITGLDAATEVLGNDGDQFYLRTTLQAPRGRIVRADRQDARPESWKELITQGPGRDVLAGVNLLGGQFAVTWKIDALNTVRFYDLKGLFQKEIHMDGIGNLSGFGGRRRDQEVFYTFTSYNQPPTLYRYDLEKGMSTLFRQPKVEILPADFEVKEVFYLSKDGTKVPMFLAHKKGLKLDGTNPTLLYGYGGFNIAQSPAYSPVTQVWMEMGGVFAVACLRGGSEYGKEWWDAGKRENKQSVFDDFIAAAEWLIANKYTNTPRLAIQGGSNGGLLVGACMTQRPELFGACLPAVGVMDMLRFHKFTIGWAWRGDYMSSETKEGFDVLSKYSPLHTLKPGVKYPPTLVTTGDHDDRVVPAHSHKFTATLQACQAGSAPVLTRIETNAGHGAGKPTAKLIAERADNWAFLVKNLGMKLPAGFAQ